MRKRKRAARICAGLAIFCGCVGSAVTGYNYASMRCAIAHGGASAPAWVALLSAIAWAVVVMLLLAANRLLNRKKEYNKESQGAGQ